LTHKKFPENEGSPGIFCVSLPGGVWGTEKLIGKLKDFIAKVKAVAAETSGAGTAGTTDERRDQKW